MNLSIADGTLTIDLSLWEKIWSLHGSLHIPLDHVRRAKRELPPSTWKEMRMPGTFLPGVIKAGTYYNKRGKEFWYVTRKNSARPLTIELENETYARVVLTLPPDAQVPSLPR